jgi:hypothetical protein
MLFMLSLPVVLHRSRSVRFPDRRNHFVLFFLIAVLLSLGAAVEICGRRRDMESSVLRETCKRVGRGSP